MHLGNVLGYGVLLAVLVTRDCTACFYSSYEFNAKDKSQTSMENVFSRLQVEPRKRQFWAEELKKRQGELDAGKNDTGILEERAYLLFQSGRFPEAEQIWKEILKHEPDRYSTLCTYATALQLKRRTDEALNLLKKAVKLKPGFRSGAEELHIRYIEYQEKNRAEPGYSARHLFMQELEPAWDKRQPPPKSFKGVKFPEIKADGLAELLRQFPSFGDGWHCLGIMAEHDGEFSLARRFYERAVRVITGFRADVLIRAELLREYEKNNDPVKTTGRKFVYFLFTVIALFVGYKILRVGSSIYRDYSEAAKSKTK